MSILILSPRYTSDSNALWKAAIQAGWSVERLHSRQVPAHLREMAPVLYGEGLFIDAVAEALELAVLEPTFCWLADLPLQYRKREIQCTTLRAVRDQKEPAFIKPAVGKSFEAKVYASGSELPAPDIFSEDMPVLVSEPVRWEIEFRCFVAERKVETFSAYLRSRQFLEENGWAASSGETAGAIQFCETLIADPNVALPPAVVIDIGYITDRGWAVVEANPAWASGIYGCDPLSVLKVLEKGSVPLNSLSNADKRWVIDKTNS